MLKIGIDVHGVLDTFPEVVKLIETVRVLDTVEIHIITGLARADAEKLIGHLVPLDELHYYSIVDNLVSRGVVVDWIDGLPYANKSDWDEAKAIYCRENDIDFMLDDSPTYGQYFNDPDVRTIFCQVYNPKRKQYNTR